MGAQRGGARFPAAPGPSGLPEPDEDADTGTSSVSTNLRAHGLHSAACAPETRARSTARRHHGFPTPPASFAPPLAAGVESARGRLEVPHVTLQSLGELLQHPHRGAHAANLDPDHTDVADPCPSR